MSVTKSYLTSNWLYDLNKIGVDGSLPLKNDADLDTFYQTVKDDPNLANAADGLNYISNDGGVDAASEQRFLVNAEYYYKVFASLLTREYHDELSENNLFFKTLKKKTYECTYVMCCVE